MDYSGKIIRKTPVTPSQTSASGVWQLDEALQAQKNNNWPVANVPNPISRSLRFRRSASAWLSRTPATTTNRRTYTLSAWVKLGQLATSHQQILRVNTDPPTALRFEDTAGQYGQLRFFSLGSSTANLVSTAFFRDPSAWYHVVLAVDTTQATSSNRVKMYVNGVQITAFDTAVYPDQNFQTSINLNSAHGIGATSTGEENFDGYITETNLIDGQALTPSSFGGTNAVTGVWEPRQYTGTYGTNGFYLNFKDNASTSTLGLDYSGNNNTWTTNNISLTAGSTYDSMLDVPTQWVGYNTGDAASVTRGNYATWNPLKSQATPTNGNLTVTSPQIGGSRATQAFTSGKWYWEVTVTNGTIYVEIGVVPTTLAVSDDIGAVGSNMSGYYASSGQKILNGSFTSYGASFTSNDVIGVAVDADANTIEFFKNGTSQGSFTMATSVGTEIQPVVADANSAASVTNTNFGQRPFTYTPPAGFLSLCTTNLPNPTILQGNQYMDISLYTGNGTSQSITNAGGMQPDWVWVKSRSSASSHIDVDVLRGTGKVLVINGTAGDQNISTYVTALNSNGFSVGNGSGADINDINNSGGSFVGWQWKANGAGVTNTAGSITSTISANTTAGFSIVTYTGTGANATVGHGLGVAPKMIFFKRRNRAGDDWNSYNESVGNDKFIRLNSNGLPITFNLWQNTSPTSSVFSLSGNDSINDSGGTFVAYAFSEIASYSKIGSYVGNGSSDGTFVYAGFRPKYVLIKRSSGGVGDWFIYDTAINTYNLSQSILRAESAGGQIDSDTIGIDILSNGFKLKFNNTDINASGSTYIYMAFAENPFKNALAR